MHIFHNKEKTSDCRLVTHDSRRRGMTFIEVLFTVGIVLMVFVAIYGVFIVSIEVVSSAKSRAGALALAQERMEQARSVPYTSLGTINGIPSGSLAQSEALTLNQVSYTRRTLVEYVDDPADGTGASDSNGITADYKRIKVEVSWYIRGSLRSVSLVGSVIPIGIESVTGGGTLKIQAFDAFAAPIAGATVHIVNTTGTSTVDVTTFTDASGQVLFPGTPSGAGYQITVSKSGYSTAQTYSATASNPNPNPGHLSIATSQTTSASFSIDRLASLSLWTMKPIETKVWTDTFTDETNLTGIASTTASGGSLILTGGAGSYEAVGAAQSTTLAPAYLYAWKSVSFTLGTPAGTSALVHVYYDTGSGLALIPDAVLAGNAAGFATSPIALDSISTSTYPGLALGVAFTTSDSAQTPNLDDWSITYDKGPTPIPNIPVSMYSTKTIGTNSSGQNIYKFSQTPVTDGTGLFATTTLEWGTYSVGVDPSTGYDISEACAPLPLSLSPGADTTLNLLLSPHTTNSLLVSVSDAVTSAQLPGVSVQLTRTGVDTTQTTSACGQTFFSSLASGSGSTAYSVTLSKAGYQSITITSVSISGQTSISSNLTPL